MWHYRKAVWSVLLLLTFETTLLADGRPNFILIMADDLGYGDLSCYGSQRIGTPHLDQLAAEGIRLTDFHSSGAVCSPTRAGLLTGRFQQRAGIPGVIFADPKRDTHPHGLQDREVTFSERLRSVGYATAIFGKWHLGYYRQYNPVRHGFDQFRGYVSGNVDFFSHVDQAGRLDWWRNDVIQDESGYTTHLITRHALAFIRQHHQQPFCLYLAYEPPHYPYQGPHDQPFRTVGKPRSKAERQQSPAEIRRAYREMVEEMDRGIGQIVTALTQSKIDQNTFLMFLSDNGATRQGENGALRGFKGQLWEGGHRVPFIARWPDRIPAGGVSSELTITLDIMPTMLAAAQVDPPANRQLDGVNLLPLLTSNTSLATRQLFWRHGNSRAMRDGAWKLISGAPGQTQAALFNLAHDLAEQNDLAAQQPARVKKMMAAIQAWEQRIAVDVTPQPDTVTVENKEEHR